MTSKAVPGSRSDARQKLNRHPPCWNPKRVDGRRAGIGGRGTTRSGEPISPGTHPPLGIRPPASLAPASISIPASRFTFLLAESSCWGLLAPSPAPVAAVAKQEALVSRTPLLMGFLGAGSGMAWLTSIVDDIVGRGCCWFHWFTTVFWARGVPVWARGGGVSPVSPGWCAHSRGGAGLAGA